MPGEGESLRMESLALQPERVSFHQENRAVTGGFHARHEDGLSRGQLVCLGRWEIHHETIFAEEKVVDFELGEAIISSKRDEGKNHGRDGSPADDQLRKTTCAEEVFPQEMHRHLDQVGREGQGLARRPREGSGDPFDSEFYSRVFRWGSEAI